MGRVEFDSLNQSPMFHFSLHAKELFHSNFLAWLGMDSELRPVFKVVMEGLGIDKAFIESWGDDFEVLREKDNIDLIVKATDKHNNADKQIQSGQWYVAIENKVKSIPNDEQLKKYADICREGVEKLLLVILGEPMELNYGWRKVNYSQVIEGLKASFPTVINDYKKDIIADYIGMIEALITIVKSQNVSLNSQFLNKPSKELDDLRIADLVDKWRAAQIADMYTKTTGLNFSSGYTNKQSIIETWLYPEKAKNPHDISICIQIQGRQYRHCIIGDINEADIVNISKGFLSRSRSEFRDKMRTLYPDIFEERTVKGEKNRKFCSYDKHKEGKTFWYQYVEIKENATIEQILNCILDDMNNVQDYLNNQFPRTIYEV